MRKISIDFDHEVKKNWASESHVTVDGKIVFVLGDLIAATRTDEPGLSNS